MEYNSIPYPNFSISEFITRKAKDFCNQRIRDAASISLKYNIDQLETELYKLHNEKDKIQFVAYVINHINEIVAEHIAKCRTPNCRIEPESQELLYFLYGQLEENDLNVDVDRFSRDDTYANNDKLNQIIRELKEVKAGQEIIFEEVDLLTIDSAITEAEELKGLQILGKKKWFKLVAGFAAEYGATKVLDEVFKGSIMPIIASLGSFITGLLK